MNIFRKNLKVKEGAKTVGNKDAINTLIQPFQEMPSTNNSGKENADRINAHDLFSLYTADIIKEDIVFIR